MRFRGEREFGKFKKLHKGESLGASGLLGVLDTKD